mgnify:CR=1 FL=1
MSMYSFPTGSTTTTQQVSDAATYHKCILELTYSILSMVAESDNSGSVSSLSNSMCKAGLASERTDVNEEVMTAQRSNSTP